MGIGRDSSCEEAIVSTRPHFTLACHAAWGRPSTGGDSQHVLVRLDRSATLRTAGPLHAEPALFRNRTR